MKISAKELRTGSGGISKYPMIRLLEIWDHDDTRVLQEN